MFKNSLLSVKRVILLLWMSALLTGCVADSHLWGLIPASTDVCAHGKDSLTGNCRD